LGLYLFGKRGIVIYQRNKGDYKMENFTNQTFAAMAIQSVIVLVLGVAAATVAADMASEIFNAPMVSINAVFNR